MKPSRHHGEASCFNFDDLAAGVVHFMIIL